MTPPGEPIRFVSGPKARQAFRLYAKEGYADIDDLVDKAIADANPGAVEKLWHKSNKAGRQLHGCKVSVETKDGKGRTTVFEAIFVEGNDERHVVRVTQGSFSLADLIAFRENYDGIAEAKEKRP